MADEVERAAGEPQEELRELIRRVVTGDGAQGENVDLTDEEWRAVAFDTFGPDYAEHFEITLRFDDWLAMVHAAREEAAASPSDDGARPLTKDEK